MHEQLPSGARCIRLHLHTFSVHVSSEGSSESAHMGSLT